MYKFWNSALALVGMLILIGAAVVITPRIGISQNADEPVGPSKPVVVVNKTNQPVPVTGSLAISGNANVNVNNSENDPVLVQSVNDRKLQPVHLEVECEAGVNALFCQSGINVPAGKRLVIEMVAMTVFDLPPGLVARLTLGISVAGDFRFYFFPHTEPAVDFGGGGDTHLLQQVRFYVDPGTEIRFQGTRSGPLTNTSRFRFKLSGYFVNVP